MPNLRLSLACGPYDRTQALIDETIRPEGIDLNYIALQPADSILHTTALLGRADVAMARDDPAAAMKI